MIIKTGITAILLGVSHLAWSMTLSEAVDLAVHTNPITKTLNTDALISESQWHQVRGSRHPQISINIKEGKYRPHAESWGESRNTTLQLTQLLYDFQQTRYRIDSAKSILSSKKLLSKEGRERLALLVSRAYLEILRLDKTLRLVDENIGFFKKLLETMKQREAAGASSYSEVQQVAALLENAKKEKIAFISDRDFAVEAFTLIVGQPPENLVLPDMQDWHVIGDKQAILLRAKTQYYGIQVKKEEIASAKSLLRASEKDLYPKLSLEASMNAQQSIKTASRVDGFSLEQQVNLVVSYDIWDGSQQRQKVNENSLLVSRSEYQLEEYTKDLEQDLQKVWTDLQKVSEEKEANKEYLVVSQEVVELYRKEFELGQKSLLDISTAYRDFHRARIDDVRLFFEYYNSVLSILLYQNAVIKQIKAL